MMQWMDAFSQTTISRLLVDKFRKVTIDIKFFLTEMWEDRKKIRLFISETTFIIRDEKLSIINTMYHEVKNAALKNFPFQTNFKIEYDKIRCKTWEIDLSSSCDNIAANESSVFLLMTNHRHQWQSDHVWSKCQD